MQIERGIDREAKKIRLMIRETPERAHCCTAIDKVLAIVTDGTAIPGLGDIGPVAGMPVREEIEES
jgi:malic enzyme